MKNNRIEQTMISGQSTIHDAINAMDKSRYGIALIVDAEKHLESLVTDGDVRRAILNGIDLQSPVEKIMSKRPVFIKDEKNVEALVEMLKGEPFCGRSLLIPVVDEDNIPKKIVNSLDLLSKKPNEKLQKTSDRPLHVLLIGGAGYIGSVLTRLLLANNYKVTILDRFLYGENSLKGIQGHPMLTIIKGDTRHIDDLVPLIRSAEAVIHLAELVGDPLCARDAQTTFEINYCATASIARICSHLQVNRFIYVSSCSVYGASANPDSILTESSKLSHVSLYAKTKIDAEKAIRELQNGNFAPCILRLGTVFGFSYRPRFDLVINVLTAKAIAEKEISIFGGTQWRPHIHVKDVAYAIKKVLEAPIEKVRGELFNVIGENYKIADIGDMVADLVPGTKLKNSNTSVDRRNYRVSGEKIKRILNFEPRTTVKDGIMEIVSALKSNPDINYKDSRYHNILS